MRGGHCKRREPEHHHRVFSLHAAAVDRLQKFQISVHCQHQEHDTHDIEKTYEGGCLSPEHMWLSVTGT